MIFVTVGNTDPFDRLVQAVEQWALTRAPREDIFVQIGNGTYVPKAFASNRFLSAPAFQDMFKNAEAVISHAGMGTIITSLEMQKPLLVMPKRAAYGEQRNEHQLATIEHVCDRESIWVANDEHELPEVIDCMLETIRSGGFSAMADPSIAVSSRLLGFVSDFVHQKEAARV